MLVAFGLQCLKSAEVFDCSSMLIVNDIKSKATFSRKMQIAFHRYVHNTKQNTPFSKVLEQ